MHLNGGVEPCPPSYTIEVVLPPSCLASVSLKKERMTARLFIEVAAADSHEPRLVRRRLLPPPPFKASRSDPSPPPIFFSPEPRDLNGKRAFSLPRTDACRQNRVRLHPNTWLPSSRWCDGFILRGLSPLFGEPHPPPPTLMHGPIRRYDSAPPDRTGHCPLMPCLFSLN